MTRQRSLRTDLAAFLKEIYSIWITERPTQFAAALAYYALFSFIPLIYIAFTIADTFVARLSVSDQFYAVIADLLGAEIARALQEAVANVALRTTGGTTIATVIGFVALALTASLTFFQLQHILNTLWQVPPPRRGQTRTYMLNRLLAFAMVLGAALLLILATLLNFAVSFVASRIDLGGPISLGGTLVFIGLAALSLALLYKVLPNAQVAWRDVWVGAGSAALLITIGLYLVQLYLSITTLSSALEAAGTVAVLLMGFYYIGQIFVLGAVIIRVRASTSGTPILPKTGQSPPDEGDPETNLDPI
jgi:membrane protein